MTGRTNHPGTKKDRPRGVISRGAGVGKRKGKVAEGVVCRTCGVVQSKGNWSWGSKPEGQSKKVFCPACTRVRERYPAGTLTIPAELRGKGDEVARLVRNLEQGEREEHPLERVMEIVEEDGALVITTTGVHLARLAAHRLAKHFHRKPRIRYADSEDLVHVDWPGPRTPRPRTKPRGRRKVAAR